jgi:branched-chain amino acid transport system substrate-binding protein
MNRTHNLSTLALAAVAAVTTFAAPLHAAPLKIAVIDAMTGPAGQTGVNFSEGVTYGVMKLNEAGGFGGEKIILTSYDNLNNPGTASEKLKLAIADGARIITSASGGSVAGQMTEDIRKYNLRNPGKEVIHYSVGTEAYEMTAEKCHFWFFRMNTNPYIRMAALVSGMKENGVLGDKVYTINQNYSYGQDMEKAQLAALAKANAKVVESTLHDTNKIQDFSPYVAKIKASGATTVLTGNWANDIILLLKASGDAGLRVRFGTTSIDTPGTLASAGPAALGSYMVKIYNMEAGGEAGKAFIEDFKAKMGHYPTTEQPTSSFAMAFLGQALKTMGASKKPFDAKQLVLTLEKTTWQSPLGTWSVRAEDHQGNMPVTIGEVSKQARFKLDNTDMGFKLVKVIDPKDTVVPVSPLCKMQRPS